MWGGKGSGHPHLIRGGELNSIQPRCGEELVMDKPAQGRRGRSSLGLSSKRGGDHEKGKGVEGSVTGLTNVGRQKGEKKKWTSRVRTFDSGNKH